MYYDFFVGLFNETGVRIDINSICCDFAIYARIARNNDRGQDWRKIVVQCEAAMVLLPVPPAQKWFLGTALQQLREQMRSNEKAIAKFSRSRPEVLCRKAIGNVFDQSDTTLVPSIVEVDHTLQQAM